mmetsp:Transcript_3734/g.6369  ORF Transcript_3734/g.6369 Transcript_3734/m.6369 type:complete len:80 (+) Transcript_3734:773-1012(+)
MDLSKHKSIDGSVELNKGSEETPNLIEEFMEVFNEANGTSYTLDSPVIQYFGTAISTLNHRVEQSVDIYGFTPEPSLSE